MPLEAFLEKWFLKRFCFLIFLIWISHIVMTEVRKNSPRDFDFINKFAFPAGDKYSQFTLALKINPYRFPNLMELCSVVQNTEIQIRAFS